MTTTITGVISVETYKKVFDRAKANGRTVSRELRAIIEAALAVAPAPEKIVRLRYANFDCDFSEEEYKRLLEVRQRRKDEAQRIRTEA